MTEGPGHPLPILRLGECSRGVLRQPFSLEQEGRPVVLLAGRSRAHGLDQPGFEVRQQDGVVAVAVFVDPVGEQLATFELGEYFAASRGPAEQLVAQRDGRPPQHAGADEKILQVGREAGQHVPGEIFLHQPGALGHAGKDPAPLGLRLAYGRQVEQLQVGGPTGGASGQGGHVLGDERLPVDIAKQLLDFPRPEAELVGADLDEQPRHPQAGQIESEVDPAGHYQPHAGRQPADQVGQGQLGIAALEQVHVVEHDEDSRSRRGEGVDDPLEAGCRVSRDPKSGRKAVPEPLHQGWLGPRDRLGSAAPSHRSLVGEGHMGEQPRLARTGRGHHPTDQIGRWVEQP